MKKVLLIIAAFLTVQLGAKAQAQTEPAVITELHALLQSAKTNFAAEIGAKLEEDTTSKIIYYGTKKVTADAETFIVHPPTGKNMYVIVYDGKGDKLVRLMAIVEQYINELNVMNKSGNYTGNDYKNAKGQAVTDMRDKAGNLVLRYTSNAEAQSIYLYAL